MQIKNKEILAVFWKHMKPYWFGCFALFFLTAINSLMFILAPWLYKQFFDILVLTGVSKQDLAVMLMQVVGWLALVKLGGWIAHRSFDWVNIHVQSHIMRDLENTAFSYVVEHSERFFANTFVGSLVRKVRRLSRSFEVMADSILFDFWPVSIRIVGALIVIYISSPLIALVMFIWMALFISGSMIFARIKQPLDETRAKVDSEVTGVLADAISGHTTVKVFTGENFERKLFARVTKKWRIATQRTWRLAVIGDMVIWGIVGATEVVVVYLSVKLWLADLITIGDIALFQGYLLGLMRSIYSVSRAVRRTHESIADAKEAVEVLKMPHEVKDTHRAKSLNVEKGKLEFKEVDFKYNKTRKIIEKLSMTIKSREKVAFVGPSGAGKSTIVKLILRFADIAGGKILVDGVPIKNYTLESLRRNISYVPQESILFHRTIMENIRYGRIDATNEEVIEAAGRARCDQFIAELPEGYETYVGERGVKLSGGERQRVAIARAILADSPILILDEATSSLDSGSELLIQEALEELMKDRTTIVIAHRLSTIMKMDRIMVINDGKLVDQGTHKQLSRKKGIYKELWEIQVGGFMP